MKTSAKFTLLFLLLLLAGSITPSSVKGQVTIERMEPASACIGDTILVKGFFWPSNAANINFVIGGVTINSGSFIGYVQVNNDTDFVQLVIPANADRAFGLFGNCTWEVEAERGIFDDSDPLPVGACGNTSFNYQFPDYCPGGSATPIITGDSFGIALPQTGIVYINDTLGTIDVNASTFGDYEIQYEVNVNCPDTLRDSITIRVVPDATVAYPFNICQDTGLVNPTFGSGDMGTFTGAPGLSITPLGVINPAATSPGTYALTHSINLGPGCTDVKNDTVKITPRDIGGLDYGNGNLGNVQFCANGTTDPLPISASPPGGTFESPDGVIINGTTGEVDLDGGATGNNLRVWYISNGACPDTAQVIFDIVAASVASLDYGGSIFCTNGSDPTPTISPNGGTFAQILIPPTPGGNSLDVKNDGRLDLSKCDPGTYYVTYMVGNMTCNSTDSVQITIVDSLPGTFAYPDTVFCESEDTIRVSSLSTPGGVFTNIGNTLGNFDPLTGDILVQPGDVGTHTIKYSTFNLGSCPDSTTFDLDIIADNTLTMSYPGGPYCQDDTIPMNPSVNLGGGTFFEATNSVLFLDTLGNIDLINTPPGTYSVGYTVTYPCQDTALDVVTILPKSDPTFIYDQASYCLNDTNPVPTILGTGGGTFRGLTGGITVNASTGEIELGNSTGGTYFVEYAAPLPCPDTSLVQVILLDPDEATFDYSPDTYCKSAANPTPVPIVPQNGYFTEPTNTVVFTDTAGTIDLLATPPGTYIINYNTVGACPNHYSDTVTVQLTDTANVVWPSLTYCNNDPNPVPQILGTGGGLFTSNNVIDFPVDGQTGQLLLNLAVPGSYIISYTTVGTCRDTLNTSFTLQGTNDPNFAFPDTICLGNPQRIHSPSFIADSIGLFFETTGGLGIVNDTFATVNLDSSISGIFFLSHRTTGACPDTVTRTVVLFPDRDATFTYGDTVFCSADAVQLPIIVGDTGGVFSSTPGGLNLDPNTGAIDPGASTTAITYTVTYNTPSPCQENSTWQVRIEEQIPTFDIPASVCINQAQNLITPTGPFTSGGVFSEPTGLLSVNPSSGVINLTNSQPGTYTVTYTTGGSCALVDRDTIIVVGAVSAAFSYPQTIYCTFDNDPFPQITGTTNGAFTIAPTAPINGTSGRIDLANTNVGPYTITYIVGGACPDTSTFSINVVAPEDASFSYASIPTDSICVTDPVRTHLPTPATPGGLYSILPVSGQPFFNTGTGQISLNNATALAGTYVVTYTTQGANGCPNSFSRLITIRPQDVAGFVYPAPSFCQGDFDPSATPTGTAVGTYSSLSGPGPLVIDANTGRVDLDASTAGTHTIQFITSGICPDTSTQQLTILEQGNAAFDFPLTEFCRTGAIVPQANLLGDNNGVFSVPDTNFNVTFSNNNLGIIDLGSSNSGLNINIMHAVPGPSGGCPDTAYFAISIVNPDTSVSITYPDTFYCNTDTNPRAIIQGDSSGVFSSFPQGGLIFLNNNNGLIDLASSTPGSYTVSYAIQNACLDTSTSFTLRIAGQSDPAFDYDRIEYCQSDQDPTPIPLDSGGVYTEQTGNLIFADNIGTIDLSASQPGPYLVYYSSPGPCPDTDFRQVTINSNPNINLDIDPKSELCERDSVIITVAGGTASSVTTFKRFNEFGTFMDSLVGTSYVRVDMADGDSVGVTIREPSGCFSSGGQRFRVFKYPEFTHFNAPITISADRPVEIVVGADEDSTYFFYSFNTSPPGSMVPEVGVGASAPIQNVGDSTSIEERFTLLSDRDPSQVTFLIRAIAKGGCAGDDSTIVINVNPNNSDIFIPEAFTPNGDDINDLWQIQLRGDQDVNDFRLDLYNDFGGLVKEMNPIEVDWDGDNLPDGVYWWILYKRNVLYLKGGLTIITK